MIPLQHLFLALFASEFSAARRKDMCFHLIFAHFVVINVFKEPMSIFSQVPATHPIGLLCAPWGIHHDLFWDCWCSPCGRAWPFLSRSWAASLALLSVMSYVQDGAPSAWAEDDTGPSSRLRRAELPTLESLWVCLKMGYTPNYSHLVGIMIINTLTIGCRGTLFSDKPLYVLRNMQRTSCPMGVA